MEHLQLSFPWVLRPWHGFDVDDLQRAQWCSKATGDLLGTQD